MIIESVRLQFGKRHVNMGVVYSRVGVLVFIQISEVMGGFSACGGGGGGGDENLWKNEKVMKKIKCLVLA